MPRYICVERVLFLADSNSFGLDLKRKKKSFLPFVTRMSCFFFPFFPTAGARLNIMLFNRRKANKKYEVGSDPQTSCSYKSYIVY